MSEIILLIAFLIVVAFTIVSIVAIRNEIREQKERIDYIFRIHGDFESDVRYTFAHTDGRLCKLEEYKSSNVVEDDGK